MMSSPSQAVRRAALAATLPCAGLLSGCSTVLLNPSGDIAAQQGRLIIQSTVLMLLIIVPVIALTLWFAWRYRASHTRDDYQPDWDHSLRLELVIWAAPLLIVIALGALTWITTHTLDPFAPLRRVDASHPLTPEVKPLTVEVVALDWKWLFIYPEQGIATVNELATPVNVPVSFRITSETAMNAFYVPAMAGMIYAMPGMESQLHAVLNHEGSFFGQSANYSGAGFSQMHFKVLSLDQDGFDRWVQQNRATGTTLDRSAYLQLRAPSIADPVKRFGGVDVNLFDAVIHRCIGTDKPCPAQFCVTKS